MLWLWVLVLLGAALSAYLWRVDYLESHTAPAWQVWGKAPTVEMAVGRHRA